MQHTRESDHIPQFKISREIPPLGILSIVGALLVQGVLMWSGQRDNSKASEQLTITVNAQSLQIQRLTEQIGNTNIKDVEHDLKISDLLRRVVIVEEGRRK